MFRKNALLFYHSEIIYVVMVLLCLTLIPIYGIVLSLLFAFPFVILILVNPKLHNEFIVIQEKGISCQKAGKQLWEYSWENIAELRKSTRFRMPSLEIIAYNKYGEKEQFALPNHYFQLGKAARCSIKKYFKT